MRTKSGIFHLWDFAPWCQYLINRKSAERHTVNRDQFMVGILCRLCGFRGQGNQERKGSERIRPQLSCTVVVREMVQAWYFTDTGHQCHEK